MIANDPLRVLSSWNDSIHFCEWYGVSCSRRHRGKVSALLLPYQELSGSVSPHIGNLSFLKVLNLSNNMFVGEIPSEIGGLRRLQRLDLYNNSLEGEIPPNISGCSALTVFDVTRNKLVGGLPWQLGLLEKLEIFGGNLLQGIIPSTLSSLRGIQVLDLSSNNLSGQIPEFLEQMNISQRLNLSYNNFEGEVPDHKLCGGADGIQFPPCYFGAKHSNKTFSHKWKIVISTVSIVIFLTLMSSCLFFLWKRGRKPVTTSTNALQLLPLSYERLYKATNGFSSENLIGVGSFGSVYKGILNENGLNTNVAVKVFNLQRHGASKSFVAECEALHCETPIVHCDLKPSNVLLDEDMVAHVGDFGLARFLDEEYGMGNKVSLQGDVYSYGILLLEMFTGRRPTEETFREGLNLHNIVERALLEQRTMEVVDPILHNELHGNMRIRYTNYTSNNNSEETRNNAENLLEDLLSSILEIGVTCSSDTPEDRVSMSEVLSRLTAIRKKLHPVERM
ncbi:Probable LRR receptor-like serine/threonine-protein kinase At3g47570 [Linum perenne]